MNKNHKKTKGKNSWRPLETRLILSLIILFLCVVGNTPSFASGHSELKHVLILYSFRYGLTSNAIIDGNRVTSRAIQSTMEERSAYSIAYHSERMDVSTLTEKRYFENMRDEFANKYADSSLDLIIAVQYRALNFLIQHGEELWPKVPIIFCGLEEGRREKLKILRPNITGIFGDARFGNQLETILKIHPETKQIIVIVGASRTERFIEARVRQTLPNTLNHIDFNYLNDMGFDEILKRVADLPPRSIVVFLTLIQDAKGIQGPENSLSLISKVSNAPVYGLFDVYVGHGIVGGTLYSVEDRAKRVAKLGARILAGEKPWHIPVVSEQRHSNLFDWRELKKWGIPERDLPSGSDVRYRPITFYSQYRWHIWITVAFIILQTILINILLFNRSKRRRIEHRLRDVIASRAILQNEVMHLDRLATMGTLTASIAHEIGQPLAAILSNAQAAKRFLNRKQPELKEVQEALEDIAINDKRAAEVIQRLRNLLKKAEPKFESFKLSDVSKESVSLLNSEIVHINASVELDIANDIPDVHGDRVQIQQVILNLLTNALHAVEKQPSEFRSIRIIITVEEKENIVFKVLDSGSGIAADTLETIFDPFHTTKDRGMGIGLSICKSIVEQHNGRIWVKNQSGKGAEVSFSLPIV